MDSCKLNWTSNPVIRMDVNRVKSGLNSTNPVRVNMAVSKLCLLSKAQSILYSAEAWLRHNNIINLLKATIQCTSMKCKCIQSIRIDRYSPLLSPLPVCKATTYVKIQDPTNKVVARFHSDDDLFNIVFMILLNSTGKISRMAKLNPII